MSAKAVASDFRGLRDAPVTSPQRGQVSSEAGGNASRTSCRSILEFAGRGWRNMPPEDLAKLRLLLLPRDGYQSRQDGAIARREVVIDAAL